MDAVATAKPAGRSGRATAHRRPGSLSTLGLVLGLAPAGIALVATIGYPLVQSLLLTFQDWDLLKDNARWVGTDNWTALATDRDLIQAVIVTFLYSGGGLLVQCVLGLALALGFRQLIRWRLPATGMLRALILAPLLIAPLIWAFYFRSFFSPAFGLFNDVLGQIGVGPLLWASSPDTALLSLVVADTWQWTPFMATLLFAALLSLPTEVLEASALDGANWIRTLIHVELPMMKSLFLVAALLRLIDSVKNIELMYVITQGGPGTATQTLNYYAFQLGFVQFDMGQSATLAYVVFGLIMVATLTLIRVVRRSAG